MSIVWHEPSRSRLAKNPSQRHLSGGRAASDRRRPAVFGRRVERVHGSRQFPKIVHASSETDRSWWRSRHRPPAFRQERRNDL